MENKINKFLEELIQEIETELDEATASGAAGAYSTPNAFSDNGSKDKNKKKKIATQLGMKLVGKVNEGKYNYKADALTAYFKGKIDAKELDKIARDDFKSGIATKKELSNFLSNKFTQDVMSDTYGIPTGTLIKRVRGLMKFAEGIDESVNEGYSKHFTYDEVVKSIVDFAKSKGYKIPSKGLDIIKGNPPSGPVRGWSRGTSIPLDKKINLSFDIYGVGKVFTVNQRLKLNKTFAESVNEAKVKRPVNRWLELKNDDSMHAHKKMAMGLKELKHQLAETQKFFNWYNKIKTMNELDSNQYWKRTNKHIYKIKERLINIAKTIQEIEK